jgi:DNA/RNA-binding domain of Phe-tRNA-synthetase-like protein
VLRGLTIGEPSAELDALRAETVRTIRGRFPDVASVRAFPAVRRFRALHASVGADPRHGRPSSQRLIEMAIKQGRLPRINSLVDAYNIVSAESHCCMGVHDLDRLQLPLELKRFDGSESFVPLGADRESPVTPGEYGYVDAANRVVCRLDVMQSELTKVTSSTSHALVIVEGTEWHGTERLMAAARRLTALVATVCGGSGAVVWPIEMADADALPEAARPD